jgi:SAM-dependent methyltransferase
MKESLTPRLCPLCRAVGSRAFEPVGRGFFAATGKEYRVARCRSCDLVQQNPSWSPAFYKGLYEHHIYDPTGQKFFPEQVERYREVANSIQQTILRARSSFAGAKLLDFGSYDGSFVSWLGRFTDWGRSVQFFGYDITLKDIPKGARFFNSLAAITRAKKRFDVVTLNHVLEHLLDPVETLADIRKRFLRPGGSVIIEVPDISYVRRGDFSPFHIQHVNYFTPHTLSRTCNRAGLAVETLRTFQNYDCGRDPLYPTVLVVARTGDGALFDGADIRAAITANRKRLSLALARLPSGSTLAVVGCGDPLSQLLPLIPKKVRLSGLFDNNTDLHGKTLLGNLVRPVEEILRSDADTVLASMVNERNCIMIEAQLRRLGFKGTIIRSFESA